MASALKLKNDIRKLKTAIDNKATNPKFLPKLKEQLAKLEDDLAKLKKPSKSGKKPYVRAEGSALTKLKNKLKGIEKKYKGYSGKTPLSLERDANRPAKPIGKRKAKSGNTYYEYRANRIDVKQPPKVFPKLEDGGYMAKGGKLSLKKFREKYDDNEDRNYHSENVVLLAENFGSESDIRDAKTILAKHEAIGSLPYNLSQERNALHDKLWAKYKEATEQSKEDGGYMAKGGDIGIELMGGQSNSELKPSGYKLISKKGNEIIVSDDGGQTKERYVKNKYGVSGYRLVYNGNDYEFTNSFEEGGYMADGGYVSPYDLRADSISNLDEAADLLRQVWISEDSLEEIRSYRNKMQSFFKKTLSITADVKEEIRLLREKKIGYEDGGYMADGEEVEYEVTGYGLGEPYKVKAKSKDEAIQEAISALKPVFGTLKKSDFSAKKLEDGGYMADGGESQGYDDREDERLAMEHGKISTKDFVGTHSEKEHSRRDDARFEERKMAMGGVAEHGLMKGDHIVDTLEDTLVIENGGKKYYVFIKTGEREEVAEKGGYMTHGGETHRSEKNKK